ncbi:MAG: DUF2065 domain-containing protein [Methylobacteriaceae bacterium]|nr:DUF2065 domain-containing protein [Methylobacteriaceae bacterium]MBV9219234.1 DUF2065 domain-containing protein [Methylobacteriaceae bacterium]MBV9245299.1 DUF2065 domain-containing protein [Methylobacteriaceae bacterium]MBV9634595.1 DUF2065 domain-containing protein [Methylobacteriaceae bacterium]MBV9636238.1 DUF2065 domain-containing protein [Methylobacteriaceae bacterium]
MRDFVAALGLVMAIEGILFAGFPAAMKRALAAAAGREPTRLRVMGLVSAICGVLIVWLARRAGF